MNAQEITKALNGQWHGSYGTARCPAHEDKTPSLSVRDAEGDKLLTHCFSGCSPAAVWGALQDSGLVERARHWPRSPNRPPRRYRGDHGDHDDRGRRQRPAPSEAPRQDNPNRPLALEIWKASHPAPGTLAEDYLRGRGITIPIPHSIHYQPGLRHADTGLNMPCLIAAVCDVDRRVTGVQRIYLTHDGRKAPLNRPKMALGALRGSAVRLAPTTDRVWLTEGVEDGLALMQMMNEPAWAVLGTSGFKNVVLPENIEQVILAPDGDDAGQAVIQETAIRLAGQGREVRAAKLPAGKDWCDLLSDYEEHAGILEFDLEVYRPDAEALARREAIDG